MAGIYFLSLARMFALVGTCLLCSTSAACCATTDRARQGMLLITENDNGKAVDIRVGESVQVKLAENATTGYRWAIDRYDEELMVALAAEPHYTAGAVGSSGEVAFVFQGTKPGTGEIALKHWRHWEGDASVKTRFRIQLQVRP